MKRLFMVNTVLIGDPRSPESPWVLVDAGIMGTAGRIMRACAERFGVSKPEAIILTHGHFDHVGALPELADAWQVPVYAHPLEFRYLNGEESYPAPDPRSDAGLMARLSVLYPRGPVDVRHHLVPLPADGTLPFLPEWRWIHSPGHSRGHISLWRARDRVLIAGDAFITTNQDSAYSVLTQDPEIHGPPRFGTTDWKRAKRSVERLAALGPEIVVSGHGPALAGREMQAALRCLAEDFEAIAGRGDDSSDFDFG